MILLLTFSFFIVQIDFAEARSKHKRSRSRFHKNNFSQTAKRYGENSEGTQKCSPSQLSDSEKLIANCLDDLVQKDIKYDSFLEQSKKVYSRPGRPGLCAKFVGNAIEKSKFANDGKRPDGCRGPEKIQNLLSSNEESNNQQSKFVDLLHPLAKALGLSIPPPTEVNQKMPLENRGPEAHSIETLKLTEVAPPSTIFGFFSNRVGKCKGGPTYNVNDGGLGHIVTKTDLPNRPFCHSQCDVCPAVSNRHLHDLVLRIKPEHARNINADTDLKQYCNKLSAQHFIKKNYEHPNTNPWQPDPSGEQNK